MGDTPDISEPDQTAQNITGVFRTSRGLVAALTDERALARTAGDFRVFDSLADYREYYDDRDTWAEVTDPAEKADFFTAAREPLKSAISSRAAANRARQGGFRVGRVFERTPAVYLPNFLSFTFVTLVASVPLLIFTNPADAQSDEPYADFSTAVVLLGIFLWLVLRLFSQAMLVYGAFQSMRGKPVNLIESCGAALREFLPLVGVSLITVLGVMIGMILIIPGLVLYTAWFVGIPVCMVERHSA